ncbi:MAG: GreA/GreB family elongation factor [Leptospirales bacterium]|nr:GreA/GreB family elongation factor [Leptospirales bacterium]MCL2155146.1 GreA/GreB family elongation factor [Leptospirales bacterium]
MKEEKIFTKYNCEKILNLLNNYKIKNPTEGEYIENLKQQILRCKPVDAKKIKDNIVTINTRLILKNLGNGSQKEYLLTLPDESNSKCEKLSILSMIGLQVLGNKIGAIVKENSDSEKYYLIERIIYQPEAAGEITL